jgi:hypothetical protein
VSLPRAARDRAAAVPMAPPPTTIASAVLTTAVA